MFKQQDTLVAISQSSYLIRAVLDDNDTGANLSFLLFAGLPIIELCYTCVQHSFSLSTCDVYFLSTAR